MRPPNPLLLVLSSVITSVQGICYYPSGEPSNQDVPCQGDDGESWCCGPGIACLSNKLCAATNSDIMSSTMKSTYVRATCTDKTWRSSQCPSFCINEKAGDRLDKGEAVERCDGGAERYYCSNRLGLEDENYLPSCSKKRNLIVFESSASTMTTIGVEPTSTKGDPESSTEAEGSSTATKNPASEKPTNDDGDGEGSGSGGLSSQAQIGIGVGVGLGGALIIGAVAFFLLRRRRRRRVGELPAEEKKKPLEASGPRPLHEMVGDEPSRKYEVDESPVRQELALNSPPSELYVGTNSGSNGYGEEERWQGWTSSRPRDVNQ